MLSVVETIRRHYKKDSALSWFVCFCAFLGNATVIGIDQSFGEAFESILVHFNSSESHVAWVGSIHTSSQFFAASISSMVAQRIGFAPVIVIGILLSSVFFVISTTSINVSMLALYYGLFAGFGMGLVHTPNYIMCSYHFIKKRSLATGLAICGTGFGILLVSEAMNFINSSYGWKGCIIICACICPLNGFMAIMAYVLPVDHEKASAPETKKEDDVDENMESRRCRIFYILNT